MKEKNPQEKNFVKDILSIMLPSFRFKKNARILVVDDKLETETDRMSDSSESISFEAFPQKPLRPIKIKKLAHQVKPIISEKCHLEACYSRLAIIEKVTDFFLDKIPPSSQETETRYEKNKQGMHCLQVAYDQILEIPSPNDPTEYEDYREKIQPLIQEIKEIMRLLEIALSDTKDRKNFLLSQFYTGYLSTLVNTYLFDQQYHLIPSENELTQIHKMAENTLVNFNILKKQNPFNMEESPDLSSLCRMINSHEQRTKLIKKSKKRKTSIEEICDSLFSPDKILNQLLITSLNNLLLLVAHPEKYPPIRNNNEKNELLLDLVFSEKPEEYKFLLKQSPELFELFRNSFAFTDLSVTEYFSAPQGHGYAKKSSHTAKELLKNIHEQKYSLNEKDEDTFSDISEEPGRAVENYVDWEESDILEEALSSPCSPKTSEKKSFWDSSLNFITKRSAPVVPSDHSPTSSEKKCNH